MSIHEELAAELKDAIRARDRKRMDVIRQVETEVARARTEPGFHGEVDDALYQRVIAAYCKKMDKARLEFVAAGERGRAQAEKLAFEIEYLARWQARTLDEASTRDLVRAAIAELGAGQARTLDEAATRDLVRAAIAELGAADPRMTGRVSGHVMKAAGGPVDGALVNRLVREELGVA
ncbi:MAG: hypothetical protein H6Q11_798 [Acidobacteria bacterium]|nr:hypothetical protein [Acidobacteriota bacterium]